MRRLQIRFCHFLGENHCIFKAYPSSSPASVDQISTTLWFDVTTCEHATDQKCIFLMSEEGCRLQVPDVRSEKCQLFHAL